MWDTQHSVLCNLLSVLCNLLTNAVRTTISTIRESPKTVDIQFDTYIELYSQVTISSGLTLNMMTNEESFVQNQLLTNSYTGWNKNLSWPNSFPSNNLLTDQVQNSQILPDTYYPILTTYHTLAAIQVSAERPNVFHNRTTIVILNTPFNDYLQIL